MSSRAEVPPVCAWPDYGMITYRAERFGTPRSPIRHHDLVRGRVWGAVVPPWPDHARAPLAINVPTPGPGFTGEPDRPSRKAAPMRHTPASTALAKYTVLDLTRARAGPTAVRQLADWGAQVIKIEMPGSDDTPDFMDRHSPDFQNLHRNKRSMTLNLKHPDGLEIFKQLARHADVIVENYHIPPDLVVMP